MVGWGGEDGLSAGRWNLPPRSLMWLSTLGFSINCKLPPRRGAASPLGQREVLSTHGFSMTLGIAVFELVPIAFS